MRSSPFQLIIETLDTSINALKPVVKAMSGTANTARHQLLLPDSEQGLQAALFAYEVFLTEGTLSGHNRTIKQLLSDYNNEWSALFDVVRDSDKTLAALVKTARDAQRAAHVRLMEILGTGNGDGHAEYAALTAALTQLSEMMGENAQAASSRSRKGKKHDTYLVPVTTAANLTGIPAVTLYRILRKPQNSLAVALNHSTEAVTAWGESYKKIRSSRKAAKHEANMMNHAIPTASVGNKDKRKVGLV